MSSPVQAAYISEEIPRSHWRFCGFRIQGTFRFSILATYSEQRNNDIDWLLMGRAKRRSLRNKYFHEYPRISLELLMLFNAKGHTWGLPLLGTRSRRKMEWISWRNGVHLCSTFSKEISRSRRSFLFLDSEGWASASLSWLDVKWKWFLMESTKRSSCVMYVPSQ